MVADPARLLALAEAVADGRALDWNAAESDTHSQPELDLVRELRTLAGLADAHRTIVGGHAAEETSAVSDSPSRWGPLEVRERLGAGAFGSVYRAWDPRLAREVALKLLHVEGLYDKAAPAVIEEGRLLARVRHPHVISVYGADQFDGRVGIWMEFIRGLTLEDVLRRQGPFSAREAASIGTDLCAALAAVHQVDLVHRDVKTSNVMREEGGRIVLMDFGAGQELSPTAGRVMAGTPACMAPELFDNGVATPQSDLYSLGVLLFRIVSGEYPVPGRTSESVRAAHQRREQRRLIDLRPDLPSQFIHVIERALAREPAVRFRTAGEMAAALTRVFPAPEADRTTTTVVVEPRVSMRRRGLLGAAAVLVVAILAGSSATVRDYVSGWLNPQIVDNIAVLPLANLSGDPAQDFFADGVTEVLMSRLGMIDSLRVIARSSIAALPAGERDPASLNKRLQAKYAVEGSVQRQGDRIRITARLVDASTGTLRWTDTFERPLGDIFALQGEIATAMATGLGARLTGDASRRLLARQTTSNEAQDAYLQGRYLLYTFSRQRLGEARELLERAVALDPEYAIAHASLSRTYAMMLDGDMAPARELQPLAVASAGRAIGLNRDLAETNVAIADVKYRFEHDWDTADAAYQQALAIAPHSSIVLSPYSRFLSAAGRLDEALQYARAGEQSDPLSPEMVASVGVTHYYRREFDEALRYQQRAASLSPNYGPAYFSIGRIHSALGDFPQAVEHIRKAMSLVGEPPSYRAELARNLFLGGWRNSGEQILGGLLLDARTAESGVSYEGIGYVYAALGELDRAFEWLNRSLDHYYARLLFVKVDPRADPLRNDPRFAALVRRLGLKP
jgi:serine/threonine protein kinase/tetratricopeptide (TPR) repeat protein